MALPGPAQDPNKIGRTPNAEWTEVPDVPNVDGRDRELPDRIVTLHDEDGQARTLTLEWSPQTVTWWEMVRELPHTALWSAMDWLFASDTALLKESFYAGTANSSDKVEMRRREDLMGLSSEARRKLRIRYVAPAAEPDPAEQTPQGRDNVTHIRATRRRDLLGDDA